MIKSYNEIEKTHLAVRVCLEKGCFDEGKEKETINYICWCCGSVLHKASK